MNKKILAVCVLSLLTLAACGKGNINSDSINNSSNDEPSNNEQSENEPSNSTSEEETPKSPKELAEALGEFKVSANAETPDAEFTLENGVLTLSTGSGVYDIEGCLVGSVVIPESAAGKVTLNMNGAAILNENGTCVEFLSTSKNIAFQLKEGTQNYLISGVDGKEEQSYDCVKSENNIHIKGPGDLCVYAYGGHAFNGSTIEYKEGANTYVTTVNDVFHGKEVVMLDGTLTVDGAKDVVDVDLNSKGKKGTFQMVNGTIIANNVETVINAESTVEIGKTDYEDGELIPFDEAKPCKIEATNVSNEAGILTISAPSINEKATVKINDTNYVYTPVEAE